MDDLNDEQITLLQPLLQNLKQSGTHSLHVDIDGYRVHIDKQTPAATSDIDDV